MLKYKVTAAGKEFDNAYMLLHDHYKILLEEIDVLSAVFRSYK